LECGFGKGSGIPYNYPPIWLLLGKLGISGVDTSWLAICIEIPALILFVVLLRGYSIGLGFVALLLVLSPSVVLGFERGNIDILEWTLVCLAALLFSERRKFLIASTAILTLAIAIKFFAVFCCAIILRFTRSAGMAGLVLITFTAGYLYSLAPVLPLIRSITPITPDVSYGYPILFNRLEFFYAPRLGIDVSGLTNSWIPTVCVGCVLIMAFIISCFVWRRRHQWCRLSDDRNGTAFLFGGGIFCGTFLFLGTNFTYRLIFLLLCLPQLFDWLKNPDGSRRMSYVLLGCCIISMWLKFHPEYTLHVNQISDWALFGIFSMLLFLNGLYAFTSFRVPASSGLVDSRAV
jgi:hypothetical protein